jgi:hypothetical protein
MQTSSTVRQEFIGSSPQSRSLSYESALLGNDLIRGLLLASMLISHRVGIVPAY